MEVHWEQYKINNLRKNIIDIVCVREYNKLNKIENRKLKSKILRKEKGRCYTII